jgi:hypothetical protein
MGDRQYGLSLNTAGGTCMFTAHHQHPQSMHAARLSLLSLTRVTLAGLTA